MKVHSDHNYYKEKEKKRAYEMSPTGGRSGPDLLILSSAGPSIADFPA